MWKESVIALVLLVGVASCFPQSRVVNGTDTTIEKYPFMVSLRASGSHSCGASILTPEWILTAAHCVRGRAASTISFQYGVTVISSNGPNVIPADYYIMHEKYSPLNNYANDIALVKLKGQLVFNYKTVGPVTLPEEGYEVAQVLEGAPGVLTGWGLDKSGGTIQKNLQEVGLKIYSDAECQERHNNRTNDDMICGGVDEGGKGQCSGDSGGPLTIDGNVQLGIVSWSIKPCTIAPYPGVYTKVSHYISWINSKINE